jgi:hypothetical protein
LYRCMFRSLSLGNLVLVIEKFEVGDGMFGWMSMLCMFIIL